MDIGECDDDINEMRDSKRARGSRGDEGRRTGGVKESTAVSAGSTSGTRSGGGMRRPSPSGGRRRYENNDRPQRNGEKRAAGNPSKEDERRRKKKDLVCYNCGGKGHPARLCPSPAAQAVDEESMAEADGSDTEDDEPGLCGVAWECSLDNCGDDDDAVFAVTEESGPDDRWRRIAAVVDSGAAENVLPPKECPHVRLEPTQRSRAGVGFRGAGGDRSHNHGQKTFKVRLRDGTTAKCTWQVADVKRPLMSVGNMIEVGNQVHLDGNPRVVRPNGQSIPLRKAGNVFLIDLWVKTGSKGFVRQD